MSNQKSVAELITFFLDKYHSGEFSKIDCNFTLHKKDDQIEKLQSALLEEKQKVKELVAALNLIRTLHKNEIGLSILTIERLIKKYGEL